MYTSHPQLFLRSRTSHHHDRRLAEHLWKDGRVVECTALERRHTEIPYRGFESLSFRQNSLSPIALKRSGFFLAPAIRLRPPNNLSKETFPSFCDRGLIPLRRLSKTTKVSSFRRQLPTNKRQKSLCVQYLGFGISFPASASTLRISVLKTVPLSVIVHPRSTKSVFEY